MKYLWTEDTGAGLHFWKLINQIFFNNELAIESKGSNQGILGALSDLENSFTCTTIPTNESYSIIKH